jgi:hypothetical protein
MSPTETYIHPDYEDFAAALAAVGPTLTQVLDPWGFYNREIDHAPVILPGFTVPSELSVVCPVVLSQTSFTVTVDAAPRTLVTGDSPAAGQVGVDWVSGRLVFHSSDDGGAAVVSLTPRESAVMAAFLHWLQAQLMATQQSQLVGTRRILGGATDLDLKAAAATRYTLFTGAAGETYTTGRVVVIPNTVSGVPGTWPKARIDVNGQPCFPGRTLGGLDGAQSEWVFEGPGLRYWVNGAQLVELVIETAAAGVGTFTVDGEFEGTRRT